ncbi:MAG: glycosyltransferase family 4 protein [bacterium]
MIFILALCFSILLTTILVPLFMKIGTRLSIVDEPGVRKIHTQAIPTTGGIALIIGSLIPFIFLVKNNRLISGICLGALCILVVGLIDDVWDLNYKWKFFGQLLAATVTLLVSDIRINPIVELWSGATVNLKMISFPLSLLFLVATSNIINLADGLDGLAGGICLLIFCCTGFFAYLRAGFQIIALCICIIGAIIGFLRYNTYPAIVFLGDTGSLFLGFSVGISMILLTSGHSIYSPAVILYIIGVPIFDTSLVILERLMEHRSIFKADKNHIHHKLLQIGFKHNEAVVIIYTVQLLMILLAWKLRFFTDGILLIIYLVLMSAVLGFFLLNKKGYLLIPHIHRRLDQKNRDLISAQQGLLSKKTACRVAWYGLIGGMLLFCLLSPFIMRPVSRDIGIICFVLILCILMMQKFTSRIIKVILRFSAYFISLFYISFLEFQLPPFRHIYNILFIGMGICYLFFLITTLEKIPFFPIDYLLLGMVIFTFFLPKTYPGLVHLNNIAARVLFMIFSIELLFYKLKEEKFRLMLYSILFALGVTCAIAFWPFLKIFNLSA